MRVLNCALKQTDSTNDPCWMLNSVEKFSRQIGFRLLQMQLHMSALPSLT
jgi:hypothetical protein